MENIKTLDKIVVGRRPVTTNNLWVDTTKGNPFIKVYKNGEWVAIDDVTREEVDWIKDEIHRLTDLTPEELDTLKEVADKLIEIEGKQLLYEEQLKDINETFSIEDEEVVVNKVMHLVNDKIEVDSEKGTLIKVESNELKNNPTEGRYFIVRKEDTNKGIVIGDMDFPYIVTKENKKIDLSPNFNIHNVPNIVKENTEYWLLETEPKTKETYIDCHVGNGYVFPIWFSDTSNIDLDNFDGEIENTFTISFPSSSGTLMTTEAGEENPLKGKLHFDKDSIIATDNNKDSIKVSESEGIEVIQEGSDKKILFRSGTEGLLISLTDDGKLNIKSGNDSIISLGGSDDCIRANQSFMIVAGESAIRFNKNDGGFIHNSSWTARINGSYQLNVSKGITLNTESGAAYIYAGTANNPQKMEIGSKGVSYIQFNKDGSARFYGNVTFKGEVTFEKPISVKEINRIDGDLKVNSQNILWHEYNEIVDRLNYFSFNLPVPNNINIGYNCDEDDNFYVFSRTDISGTIVRCYREDVARLERTLSNPTMQSIVNEDGTDANVYKYFVTADNIDSFAIIHITDNNHNLSEELASIKTLKDVIELNEQVTAAALVDLNNKLQLATPKMIHSTANTTAGGYQVPQLTADDVTEAYNAIIAGRAAIVVDKDEQMHAYINQADSLDGNVSIGILYYSYMLLTYTLEGDNVIITTKEIS